MSNTSTHQNEESSVEVAKDSATQDIYEQFAELSRELSHHKHLISRYKKICESLPAGVLCVDSNLQIIMVNSAVESFFGYSENELLGQYSDVLYHDREDYQLQVNTWLNGEAKVDSKTVEVQLKTRRGEVFTAEIFGSTIRGVDGGPVCFVKMIRDITTRKVLEDSLRQMEVKFRTVADFTYNWECWIQPDGMFCYVSPSCERISGYSADEFMANPALLSEIMHPDDIKAWERHHQDSKLMVRRRELEFRIIRRDGEVRWIEHACQAVVDGEGNFLGYRSSNRDITKRKNYEEELRKALFEIELFREQLEAESAYLKEEIKLSHNYDNIVGTSNALQYVLFRIEQIAAADTNVLLLGETGTGKELFARAIHNTSKRHSRPLVKINCATLPANLIESELFGHERGSFTTAHSRQVGRFEVADKATLFLDEIGELPLELQAKLLRVLQEGEFERLGSSKTIKVDVRVIAATNRNLEADVQNGLFRKDLWYRLNVFPITAPPLRDRVEDVPLLVWHFLQLFAKRQGKNITAVPVHVMKMLEQYPWPGNVRELENVIERAVISTSGTKLVLADELKQPLEKMKTELRTLDEVERGYILEVLEKTDWKVSGKNSAADILGLKRSTLRARMDKHNIRKP